MKRFRWPLQRLLDVTVTREQAQRAELMRLSGELVRVRGEIAGHRQTIRASLARLRDAAPAERHRRQEVVFSCAEGHRRWIEQLEAELEELSRRRREQTERLLKTRKGRQSLEKKREHARLVHQREQARQEQKVLDDGAQIAFNRRRGRPAADAGHAEAVGAEHA